jgi:hypothetical protein
MRMPTAVGVSAALLALVAPVPAQPALSFPAPGAVALVDFHALTIDAWKRESPAIDRVFSSMRMGDAQAPAAPRPAQGASGPYLATVRRLVFRATGGTDWVTTTEFYLLSPEGRVQRGHGLPEVPGGDLRRFDYENARRADPGNSGSYTTSGNRLTITIGEERISATVAEPDELEIRGTKFKRSVK